MEEGVCRFDGGCADWQSHTMIVVYGIHSKLVNQISASIILLSSKPVLRCTILNAHEWLSDDSSTQ
eukprot:scaffold340_cov190-Chaetoceros_neogracile.AAC.4